MSLAIVAPIWNFFSGFYGKGALMSSSGLTLVYDCGFGGCQAPTRPISISCPDPSKDWQNDEVGKPIFDSPALRREIAINPSLR